ncbi:MAG: hypothetical protein AB7K24_15135 [Gemmataceae bacterium]
MHDTFPNPEAVLAFQALLYASGELEGAEARAFEQRLAADQAAREALGQAVQLTSSLAGEEVRPDPSWRAKAQARLQPRPRLYGKLTDMLAARRTYRGHPFLWTLSGAAAAMLCMAILLPGQQQAGPMIAQNPANVQQAPTTPEDPGLEPGQESRFGTDLLAVAPTSEQAKFWAKLHNTDHLAKAHGEETKRKLRIEEQKRMTSRMGDMMKSRLPTSRPSEKP